MTENKGNFKMFWNEKWQNTKSVHDKRVILKTYVNEIQPNLNVNVVY